MPLAEDIRVARKATESLLDQLGLHGFVYTLEHKEQGWTLRVDCAADEGVREATLVVDLGELRASLGDPGARNKLLGQWEPHFRACARRGIDPTARS